MRQLGARTKLQDIDRVRNAIALEKTRPLTELQMQTVDKHLRALDANNIDFQELTTFRDDLLAQSSFVADWHVALFGPSDSLLQRQIAELLNHDAKAARGPELDLLVHRLSEIKVPRSAFDPQV